MRTTVRRRRGERGFAALLGAVMLLWLLQAALVVALIAVAIHFILKFW